MGATINIGGKDSVAPIMDGLNRRIDKMEQGLGAVAKQSKATQREAERLWKASMSPAEKYNETLKKARALLDGTAEGQRKYARVVEHANARLKQQQSMFGGSAVSQLHSYAAGMLSVGSALRVVTGAYQKMREASEGAAAAARGAVAPRAELAQLAGGDPRRFQAFLGEAREAFRAGVGDTQGDAERLIFQVRSAGATQEMEFFKRLSQSRAFGDVPGLAKASAAMRTSLGPQGAGTYQDVINQALVASGYNPQGVAQLLEAAAVGGGSAKQLGVSAPELLSATAISATAAGSSSIGGTRVAALLRQADRSGRFQGMGLEGIVAQLQAHERGGGRVQDILGERAEATQAYRDIVGNIGTFRRAVREGREARGGDLALRTADLPATDPILRAAEQERRARARRQISQEPMATRELQTRALAEDITTGIETGAIGMDPIQRQYARWIVEPLANVLGALMPGQAEKDDQKAIRSAVESMDRKQGSLQPGIEN